MNAGIIDGSARSRIGWLNNSMAALPRARRSSGGGALRPCHVRARLGKPEHRAIGELQRQDRLRALVAVDAGGLAAPTEPNL